MRKIQSKRLASLTSFLAKTSIQRLDTSIRKIRTRFKIRLPVAVRTEQVHQLILTSFKLHRKQLIGTFNRSDLVRSIIAPAKEYLSIKISLLLTDNLPLKRTHRLGRSGACLGLTISNLKWWWVQLRTTRWWGSQYKSSSLTIIIMPSRLSRWTLALAKWAEKVRERRCKH